VTGEIYRTETNGRDRVCLMRWRIFAAKQVNNEAWIPRPWTRCYRAPRSCKRIKVWFFFKKEQFQQPSFDNSDVRRRESKTFYRSFQAARWYRLPVRWRPHGIRTGQVVGDGEPGALEPTRCACRADRGASSGCPWRCDIGAVADDGNAGNTGGAVGVVAGGLAVDERCSRPLGDPQVVAAMPRGFEGGAVVRRQLASGS